MKKMKLLTLLPLLIAPLMTTGCSGSTDIGILQYGEFPALDDARKGFEEGLKEEGFGNLKIDYQNAKATAANNSNLAKGLASKNHKLNLAIATPCATALKAAQDSIGSKTPLLFTAVTDPVGSGLVMNEKAPEGYITGSSDLQPGEALENQIKLVKKMLDNPTKLGIFYCANEENSRVQAGLASAIAATEGLEVVTKTFTDALNIKASVAELAPQVDAIWVPTDNTVANNISKVKDGIGENKVLLIVGEEGMLSAGQVTVSISYYELGKKTAKLAAEILNGKAIKEVPVFYSTIEQCSYVFSKKNLEDAGFSKDDLPSEYTWTEVE